jgi:NHL repeat
MSGMVFAWLAGQVAHAGVAASSEGVADNGTRYSAAAAFDGSLATAWAEGALGDGDGAWLEVKFDRPVDIESISIFPGWLPGMNREIKEYGRPKLLTLTIGTAGEPVVKQERLLDVGYEGPMRHDVVISVPAARSVRITLDESYSGGLYADTFITEVAVNLVAGNLPPSAADLKSWVGSEAGAKAADAQKAKVVALFEKVTSADFGDRDALRDLMSWAQDGAPYVRERAIARGVPAGFKLPAIEPDRVAVDALLKLKDSNAIPAIERAALRTTGKYSEDLKRRARLFDAYQEMLGGGGRNAVPWGQKGIGKGELKGNGEPLDLVVDDYGSVWVADVGNHRVVRFSEKGTVEKMWGNLVPSVSEMLYGRRAEGYASGATAGTEVGQFTNPVDLALVPDGGEQGVLVLDGAGRVSYISPDGTVAWNRDTAATGKLRAGVGGTGHVLYWKGKVIVIYGDEGIIFTLKDWTEVSRFELKDGMPTGAIVFKDGRFALVYQEQLILYAQDGFRLGDIVGDSLGEGFQDWSVTLDEKGKLWAALDTGEIVKFKKPGKVDFRVPIANYPLKVPRITAFDDLVYVTTEDRVLHADALELLEAQEAGEESDEPALLNLTPEDDQ